MSPRLHLVGNAHIDPVWLWQWTEGFHEVKATFRSALDRMNEDPDFIFSASSAAFYEWVEQSDPVLFAEIRQRVHDGRWELCGGWWVEPDCNIPAGESFARHGLLAQRYFMEKFGRRARVGYAPDSFGHNGGLPQILKLSGMDAYVFMRPGPHEKELPGRLFWWQGADGSRVLVQQILFDYSSWGHALDLHVERCAAELKPPVNELMCFYGVGDHGGGPTRENLASLHRLQQQPGLPQLAFSSPERFFDAVRAHDWNLPAVSGDLQHHASGCYAAHSGIKRWNRQAENLLLAAEKWAMIGQVAAGQAYPADDLRRAWKNLLFNQFHDVLAGTSLEAAYEDARAQLGEAMSLAGRALNLAAQALAWQIDIPSEPEGLPLAAFNPHAWPQRANLELEIGRISGGGTLLDPRGAVVPFQWVQSQATASFRSRIRFSADLPPLGYAVYRLLPGEPRQEFPDHPAGDTVLENGRFRLEIDPATGAIASLYDKLHAVEVFAGPAARAVVIDDPSDTWSHGVFRFDQVCGEFALRAVRLVEHGPVVDVIRVICAYHDSTLVQEFCLYRDLERIDVRVTVDWREHFKLLKLRFPLNLENVHATAEIPYGAIERPASGDEEPCQGWVDVSGVAPTGEQDYGLCLLNDAKYSYDVSGGAPCTPVRAVSSPLQRGCDLGLTVLRSPVYANHMPAVPAPDGFYSFIDQGIQQFTYALLPHAGGWEDAGAPRRAAELNQPAWLSAATFHPGRLPLEGSFLSVEPENILLSACKQADDRSGWIVRAYETDCRPSTAARIDLPGLRRSIAAYFGPAEIKTFLVPEDASQPIREVNLLEDLK